MSWKIAAAFIATTIGPSLSNAQDANSFFRNAFDQFKLKNYRSAEDLFKAGLERDDKDAQAWRFYGESLEANKLNTKARNAYKRAIALMANTPERTIIESKIKNLKPSIIPGSECRALVEKVDPLLLQSLADRLIETPEISGNKSVVKSSETVFSSTSVLCGDLYIYKKITYNNRLVKRVSMIGYPHVRLADDSDDNNFVILKSFTGLPFDSGAESQSFSSTAIVSISGPGQETSITTNCSAKKIDALNLIFDTDCRQDSGYQSSRRTKYLQQFDEFIEEPTESKPVQVISVEALK